MAAARFEALSLGTIVVNGSNVRYLHKSNPQGGRETTWIYFDKEHCVLVFGEVTDVAESLWPDEQ